MTKNFFLTLDLKEWFHLEYLKPFVQKESFIFVNDLNDFLDKNNITITIFVLYDIAKKYPLIIKELRSKGHEIALHGYDHELLYNLSPNKFEKQTIEAKDYLENLISEPIIGYRAACFSMDEKKLSILNKIGFMYDSSYIKFSQHNLYNEFKIDDFKKISDFIYEKNNFYEFEIPTFKFFKFNIPISGGGYFRFFPYLMYKTIFVNHISFFNNYIFYVHPFELNYKKFDLPNVPFKYKLRFNIGRKNNLNNLKSFILLLKNKGFKFSNIKEYIINLQKDE